MLDFFRSGLKHPAHGYVGDFAPGMAEILLPVAARPGLREPRPSSASGDAEATLEASLSVAR